MSQPINVFKSTTKTTTTANLTFFSQQVAYWQQLSKLVQPLLPQPEQWQVVCYEHGVLTLSGANQAMISQLNYMQTHYVAQLNAIPALQQLNKIRAILRYTTAKMSPQVGHKKSLSPETQQMLHEAAHLVQDAKLSQALMALASNKK